MDSLMICVFVYLYKLYLRGSINSKTNRSMFFGGARGTRGTILNRHYCRDSLPTSNPPNLTFGPNHSKKSFIFFQADGCYVNDSFLVIKVVGDKILRKRQKHDKLIKIPALCPISDPDD